MSNIAYNPKMVKKYNLVNTDTEAVLKKDIELSPGEASNFNYAFALNGAPKKYIDNSVEPILGE